MKGLPSLGRATIAAIVTSVVLLLVATSCMSLNQSCVQETDDGTQPYVVIPEFQTVSSLTERVRAVRPVVPKSEGCERRRIVSVRGAATPATWWMSPLSGTAGLLAAAAVLFAGFGLFVLWWGRDAASFWLGVGLSTLAPSLVPIYGFVPELLGLIFSIAANGLTVFGVYAFFMMADTVARESTSPAARSRAILDTVRACVVAVLTATALAGVTITLVRVSGAQASPWLARVNHAATNLSWEIIFCALPLGYLILAAARSRTDAHRVRAVVILVTTAVGLSGVVFSLVRQHGNLPDAPFDAAWFTLLAIPIGFIIGMAAYRVFDFKFIVTRVLVSAILAVAIYLAFYFTELRIKPLAQGFVSVDPSQQQFSTLAKLLVGFVVANSFGRVKKALNTVFRKIVFKQRDQGVLALQSFAARSPHDIGPGDEIAKTAVHLVWESLRTRGVAMYEVAGDAYTLGASVGTDAWPAVIQSNDPACGALDASAEPVSLAVIAPAESALGREGLAYAVVAGGHRIGVLALRPHTNEADGDFDDEERSAIAGVVRFLGDTLLSLRLREFARLLDGLSAGTIGDSAARMRASELRKDPLLTP